MEHDDGQDPIAPPAAPSGAAAVFSGRLELAEQFAGILADTGVSHGLIGPREVPRLWDRHLLNCAVIEDAFPPRSRVIDVGSGAGLPGLVLAIVRPNLEVHLVEPMERRTAWLGEAVRALGLDGVTVHRARAEEVAGWLSAPFVTARAVARLDKLARWCLPLLVPGGTLVAMKGERAEEELAQARPSLRRLGVVSSRVSLHGVDVLEAPVRTVDLVVDPAPKGRSASASRQRTRR